MNTLSIRALLLLLENVSNPSRTDMVLAFKPRTHRAAAAALEFRRLGWCLGMGLGPILEHHNVFQWKWQC